MQSIRLGMFSQGIDVEELSDMNSEDIKCFFPIYSTWFGIPVLLFVIRQCRVPIPCNIIGESIAAVRVELEPGWKLMSGRSLF